LLWFRNDLRIHDNPALLYFLENNERTDITANALFFICKEQWHTHHDASIKIDLMLRHVNLLSQQLLNYGIALNIVECNTFNDQIEYLKNNVKQHGDTGIIVNQQLEFNEQARDRSIIDAGIKLIAFEGDVIVPKGLVLNKQNEMYKVFTPFKKAWLSRIRDSGFKYDSKQALIRYEIPSEKQSKNPRSALLAETDNSSEAWPLIDYVEQNIIPEFFQDKLEYYADNRDIPGIKGTSGLSPYLAIGALSPRYLLRLLLQHYPDLLQASDSKPFVWLNELCWREFYRHLMHHFPRLSKGKDFNQKYHALPWLPNESHFKSWCEGKTGYPLVDAAMRQLNQTGWMHNRLRMVVASFLTKHLLIDWRWGEQYFMSRLIDGDLAANNGGWQWAASTGCDAQPYFRIFNPIRQSERFDPKGDFIRKYLPELADIPNKEIHFPHGYIKKFGIACYWPALVDHKAARERALAVYKAA
jgi:deoxyribodipyrimidine photo-lyase